MDSQRLSEIRNLLKSSDAFVSHAELRAAAADLLTHLSSVQPPDRVRAAERAVVDAAVEWRRLDLRRHDLTNGEQQRIDDLFRLETEAIDRETEAIDRLRDLRAAQAAEECGAFTGNVGLGSALNPQHVRCDQPRGHDGECSGDLGRFQWRKST